MTNKVEQVTVPRELLEAALAGFMQQGKIVYAWTLRKLLDAGPAEDVRAVPKEGPLQRAWKAGYDTGYYVKNPCHERYFLPSEHVRAVVEERTPQDYAIEHAGYLATAADSVQEAYKTYSLAQMNVDEAGDDGEGELNELVDDARDDLHEALNDLRGMTYEFRKRRARAIQ